MKKEDTVKKTIIDTNNWPKLAVPALVAVVILIGLFFVFQQNLTATSNLVFSQASQPVLLQNGERFSLSANPVLHQIDSVKFAGYAYNNQFPGPTLKVKQGSSVFVDFKNNLPEPTTVHWHGLRLENKFDGVPDVTQKPVLSGESFEYKLDFPDAGLYWFHPHVREDRQQELGLYGTILVEPVDGSIPKMREEVLVLDDILLENHKPAAFGEKAANFAVMGRFGSEVLVNGKKYFVLNATAGEPVRLFVLNAANARPFRFAIEDSRLKIVGSDDGFLAAPFFDSGVTLGPSERGIVEVLFEREGDFDLQSQTPSGVIRLGTVRVTAGTVSAETKQQFESLNENTVTKAEFEKIKPFAEGSPDWELELDLRWPAMDAMMQGMSGGMMGMHQSDDGIEWDDYMQVMNAQTTTDNAAWIVRDKKTGKENEDLVLSAKKGEIKKIRFTNVEGASHPMQHVMHLHGNRFIVLEKDGVKNEHWAWKDSVMVPTNSTMDVLVEFSNEGDWMLHCHIAEHLEAGMMTKVKVET